MRKRYAQNIITKLFCWILLLQIINISIDPPNLKDFKTTTASKETQDEIDSIYELVAENIFDCNVPDTESEDDDIDQSSNTIELYFSSPNSEHLVFNIPIEHYSFYKNNFLSLVAEPTSPPPKTV